MFSGQSMIARSTRRGALMLSLEAVCRKTGDCSLYREQKKWHHASIAEHQQLSARSTHAEVHNQTGCHVQRDSDKPIGPVGKAAVGSPYVHQPIPELAKTADSTGMPIHGIV